jgi:hypothetical protein
MLYQICLLKRYGTGPSRVMKTRAHTASSDLEAIRTIKENFHIFAPTASGFTLRRKDGAEIYRWFKTDEARNANGGKQRVSDLWSSCGPSSLDRRPGRETMA